MYHPYLSHDRNHDQSFVKWCVNKLVSFSGVESGGVVIIDSDNCKLQYKSAEHLDDMQEIAN